MRVSRYLKEKLLPILASRITAFFFLMCLFTWFLYAAGTVQGFIDTTQLALLRLAVVLGIFLIMASVYGLILLLGRFFREKRFRYLFRSGAYLFLMVFGAITLLASMFIITASTGNWTFYGN